MRDSVLPVAKMGWCRFAAKGAKALAGNRVAAGKAAIVARHIAILTALQIDFEVLTEWGTQLVPCRLEISRLHFCHICPRGLVRMCGLAGPDVFPLLSQTLPHQHEGVGDGGVVAEKLALFSSVSWL